MDESSTKKLASCHARAYTRLHGGQLGAGQPARAAVAADHEGARAGRRHGAALLIASKAGRSATLAQRMACEEANSKKPAPKKGGEIYSDDSDLRKGAGRAGVCVCNGRIGPSGNGPARRRGSGWSLAAWERRGSRPTKQGLCGVCDGCVCNQKPGTRGFPLDRIFIVLAGSTVLRARLPL